MTKDEALKLALEAMEYADACLKKQLTMKYKHEYAQDLLLEAGTAIKEVLAQPEQEPVGEVGQIDIDEDGVGYAWFTIATDGLELGDKLYTSPPQRKSLTDEQIEKISEPFWDGHLGYGYADFDSAGFARAIEAAHGIKGEA